MKGKEVVVNNNRIENFLVEIESYKPYNEQEEKDKEIFLRYLTEFNNSFLRDNEFGHFCSAAFVLNESRDKILMIYHNIYDSWGWLGGHADGDADTLGVAIKEVKEESGLSSVKPISKDIFTIDSLPVLGHFKKGKYVPAHVHLTVAYLLEASEQEELKINEEETSGVKWLLIDEFVSLSNEPQMQYVYNKGVERMKDSEYIA